MFNATGWRRTEIARWAVLTAPGAAFAMARMPDLKVALGRLTWAASPQSGTHGRGSWPDLRLPGPTRDRARPSPTARFASG